MADGDTTTSTGADAQYQALLQQIMAQPSAPQPIDTTARATSVGGLLGEALGGGLSGAVAMTPEQQNAAGLRALMGFGANMLAGSGYSTQRRTFGQVLAEGLQGAQQGMAGTEAAQAAALGAQQEQQYRQQQMQLERLKAALPLLQYQMGQQGAQAALKAAGFGAQPSTSIGAVGTGAPGPLAAVGRDTSVPTAGQQANNPGNIMADGGTAPFGATGYIPVAGGRKVAVYPDLTTGIAANAANLASYASQGINTVADAVKRWVGDPKADLTSYTADVAKAIGVKPTDTIDLTNPAVQKAFILAQQPHETGKSWLNPADVDKGVALAQSWRPGAKPYTVASNAPVAPPSGPPAATPEATPYGGTPVPPGTRLPMPPTPPGAAPSPAPLETADDAEAAKARAAKTGRPVLIAKGGGLAANPDGSIGTPPGGAGAVPASWPMPPPAAEAPPAAPQAPPAVAPPPQAPPAPAPQPPPKPQFPDIKAGDGVISHPGSPADFLAANKIPPQITPGSAMDPNLTPAEEAAYQAKLANAATQMQSDPAKAQQLIAEAQTARASLVSQKQKDAAAAIQAYNDKETTRVSTLYDTALKNYNDAAHSQLTFNQDNLKAEGASQRKSADDLVSPYVTGATQAQQILPSLDIAKQILPSLPGKLGGTLLTQNEKTLAYLEPFMPAGWKDQAMNAGLFQQIINGTITAMGGNVQSGAPGGREAAYEQFRSQLPTLSQGPEGRELAIEFAREMALRRIAEATFLQNYRNNPANLNSTTGAPNMSGALTAMNAPTSQGGLGPMVRLPPRGFDPEAVTQGSPMAQSYQRYTASVPNGGRYFTYDKGDDGKFHPRIVTKGQED